MKSFTIRETTEKDLEGIGKLSLERGEDPEIKSPDEYVQWWNWLYWKNPYDISDSLVGVDENDNVQGHIGFVPYLYRIHGKQSLVGFIIQLMVSEDYNHTLLFPAIEIKLLKEYRDYGLEFANGLVHRPHIVKAHCAIGYKEIGRVPVYARPYRINRFIDEYLAEKKILATIGKASEPVIDTLLKLDWKPESGNLKISRV